MDSANFAFFCTFCYFPQDQGFDIKKKIVFICIYITKTLHSKKYCPFFNLVIDTCLEKKKKKMGACVFLPSTHINDVLISKISRDFVKDIMTHLRLIS